MSASEVPAEVMTADQAIKLLRRQAGLSQTQLADMTEHDHSWLSRIEARTRQISWDGLDDIATALQLQGVQRDWFFLSARMLPEDWEQLMAQPSLLQLIQLTLDHLDDPQVESIIAEGLRFISTLVDQASTIE